MPSTVGVLWIAVLIVSRWSDAPRRRRQLNATTDIRVTFLTPYFWIWKHVAYTDSEQDE